VERPHISSFVSIYLFVLQQRLCRGPEPSHAGCCAEHSGATLPLPHRADALRRERETLPASLARHTLTIGTRAPPGVRFPKHTHEEARGTARFRSWAFPAKRGQGTVFAQLLSSIHRLPSSDKAAPIPERLSVLLREKLGWWKIREDSPRRRCVFSPHSKSHRKSPDYSPFPRNPGWKKIKGPHYFPTNTHTCACTHKGALQRP